MGHVPYVDANRQVRFGILVSKLNIAAENICGVNSRRFKGVDQKKPISHWLREKFVGDLTRDTQTDLSAFEIFGELPSHCTVKVAESGISTDNIGSVLRKYPFNAALIGTSLLKAGRGDMRSHLDGIQAEAEKALETNVAVPAADVAFAR